MGRVVRSLMKVPAVRRVMLRLANAEAAIAGQRAQLGQLDALLQRLSADGADHRTLLAQISKHMPPARQEELEAAIKGQEAAIKGQEAQIGALTQRVQQLSADHDSQHALLAEVSQHLPPAQRANLETTLHGQQLQLGALNSTIHANQIQLGSLNDVVQRLSAENASQRALLAEVSAQVPSARLASLETTIAEQQARLGTLNDLLHQFGTIQQEKQALADKITNLEQENRRLKVGHGATFEELVASGKLSLGAPYRFEDLLSLRQMAGQSAPSVPPLVHIHVPKAAGTTLNNILMRNYKYRVDSYGTEFFPRYFPSEFVSLVSAPPTTGDRIRPMFFTGHIGLGNELFRRMPVRYVAITMLREPVSRVISHYRFNSTAPSIFQSAIQNDRLDVIEYFHRFRSAIPLQYEYFAQGVNVGDESQPSRAAEALRNLVESVSIFGIQDEFDEFVVLLAELLGLPDAFYIPLNMTPDDAATVNQKHTEELRKLLADDITFYESAVSLYRQRTEALTFDLADRVKVFKQEKNRYLKLRNHRPHPWRDSYS